MSKKEIREKRKKIKKIVVISSIIGIILLFHSAWAVNRFVKYGHYARAVGYNEETEDYYGYDEDATYYVVLPFYPTFESFMNICYSDETESYDMFIYPKLFGGYECSFSYSNEEKDENIEIWFDENFEILDDYESTGTIKEYEKQIEKICDLTYKKWGILKYDKE